MLITIAKLSAFSIELGRVQIGEKYGTTVYQIPFILKNGNDQACGAEIEMRLLDSSGRLVTAKTGWPASTSNVPAGGDIAEDWGSLFTGKAGGSQISVQVRRAKQWR